MARVRRSRGANGMSTTIAARNAGIVTTHQQNQRKKKNDNKVSKENAAKQHVTQRKPSKMVFSPSDDDEDSNDDNDNNNNEEDSDSDSDMDGDGDESVVMRGRTNERRATREARRAAWIAQVASHSTTPKLSRTALRRQNRRAAQQLARAEASARFAMDDVRGELAAVAETTNSHQISSSSSTTTLSTDITSQALAALPRPVAQQLARTAAHEIRGSNTQRARRKRAQEEIARMHQVLSNSRFRADPLGTVQQHVRATAEQQQLLANLNG